MGKCWQMWHKGCLPRLQLGLWLVLQVKHPMLYAPPALAPKARQDHGWVGAVNFKDNSSEEKGKPGCYFSTHTEANSPGCCPEGQWVVPAKPTAHQATFPAPALALSEVGHTRPLNCTLQLGRERVLMLLVLERHRLGFAQLGLQFQVEHRAIEETEDHRE